MHLPAYGYLKLLQLLLNWMDLPHHKDQVFFFGLLGFIMAVIQDVYAFHVSHQTGEESIDVRFIRQIDPSPGISGPRW